LTRFAHAVREELWSRGRLLESRLEHGQAIEDAAGIVASDARDDALVAAAERELERLRAAMPRDALVRLVAEASTEGVSSTITVRTGPLSIVTTPAHINKDRSLLRNAGWPAGPPAPRALPLFWLNGSAAVLLHEAHGHPLEHGHAPLRLPSWLQVDVPLRLRRASFRDVPLVRMTEVRATQVDAPFELPGEYIAVHLVDGGAYEPLTGVVTVRIASATHGSTPVAPFDVNVHRDAIRFLGAAGESVRYPGVICSREGQELVVDSYAPAIITELA
jgi:hypothetical protein